MTRGAEIAQRLSEGEVLLLDGAMGTMLQRKGHSGCLESVSITHPTDVEHIHAQYMEAGSDIITTNTFGAHPLLLARYGLHDRAAEIIAKSTSIARQAANRFMERHPSRSIFVAGVIGSAIGGSEQQMREGYRVVVEELLNGGVDLILVETIYDIEIGRMAVEVAKEVIEQRAASCKVRLAASATATKKQPRPIEILQHIDLQGLFAVGFNCGFGAAEMLTHIEELSRSAESVDRYIVAYPNAGLPSATGEYEMDAEAFAEQIKEYLQSGTVDIIGGCCGTTPNHIAAIRRVLNEKKVYK